MTETNPGNPVQSPINSIAKSDLPSPHAPTIAAFSYPSDHPAVALWSHPQTGLLHRLNACLKASGSHPARTLVLLPYAQLRPLANRLWAQTFTQGFTPRFETSVSWTSSLGGRALESSDIHFDDALDSLTAHHLLALAGLRAHADVLTPSLVQCAQQLATLASCMAPTGRAAWARRARQTLDLEMAALPLQWEAAVARIAMEWAAMSSYQGDALFDAGLVASLDCLVVVQGLQPDQLASALAEVWGDKLLVLPLAADTVSDVGATSHIVLRACKDAEDEAQQAAACALRHIEAGRFPLALVSSDRALTRRVRAMLDGAGVQIRDENGWKLSTSMAAAKLMAVLKAAVWNASADAVVAWLKYAPAFASDLGSLEAAMRREQLGVWHQVAQHPRIQAAAALTQLCMRVNEIRATLAGRHSLLGWLQRLAQALRTSDLWDALQADAAGAQVLSVLKLEPAAYLALSGLAEQAAWGTRQLDIAEFTTWVNRTLESANFQPVYPHQEEVVILPMSQMLGRPFAALVIAGCDELRLPPSPDPPGTWTTAQRAALGLPTRATLEAATLSAWHAALQTPACDVLWRTGDDAGETLLPSALVQLLMLDCAKNPSTLDPREPRRINAQPVPRPMPTGAALPVSTLSQSAYDDLRQCPYRFFALRQLGLTQVDELESELDKRDFGIWLHEVLKRFHQALDAQQVNEPAGLSALMDAVSVQATQAMALPEGDFLPYAVSWPAVRDGYLAWYTEHAAQGMKFTSAETAHRQTVASVALVGRIDRIDTAADGSPMLLDYKTENVSKTSARAKNSLEDTQMAFYAALLPHDTLRAGYVNISEYETKLVEQTQVVPARDALIEGIASDMQRIGAGAPLPALGEGDACAYCKARGLCRRDFWVAA